MPYAYLDNLTEVMQVKWCEKEVKEQNSTRLKPRFYRTLEACVIGIFHVLVTFSQLRTIYLFIVHYSELLHITTLLLPDS